MNKSLILSLLLLSSPTVWALDCPEGTKLEVRLQDDFKELFCVKDGRTDGPLEERTLGSDNLLLQGSIKNGKPDGKLVRWYDNGNKKSEGAYVDGQMNGVWSRYHRNGKLRDQVEWIDGVPTGDIEERDANGMVMVSGHYECGEKTGTWKSFNASGLIRSDEESSEFGCKKFRLRDFRLGLWDIYTNNGFALLTGFLEWAPTFRLGKRFRLLGQFGGGLVKNNNSSLAMAPFGLISIQWILPFQDIVRWELGTGLMTWVGFQSFQVMQSQLSVDTTQIAGLKKIPRLQKIFLGANAPFSTSAFLFSLGVDFHL